MQDMKVKSIAPWFGGKRTLAPDIVKELGKHTQYFEPFCGSMAVLFAKEPTQKETVNDLHGDLVNLARVLQELESAEALYERLTSTLFCEDLLKQARKELDDESSLSIMVHHGQSGSPHSIDRAYWYFIASWMGRNGTAGTQRIDFQISVRWTKSGGSPTVRWKNAVGSIPAWHQRLLNVVILCRNAFMILDRFEDVPETAIYVDPPYFHSTRSSNDNRTGGAGRYLHDFSEKQNKPELFDSGSDEHEKLAEILHGYRNARIVISYYDCPRVRNLYDGWTFIDKTRQKHLHVQNGRGSQKKEAPEVLIVNGESFTT